MVQLPSYTDCTVTCLKIIATFPTFVSELGQNMNAQVQVVRDNDVLQTPIRTRRNFFVNEEEPFTNIGAYAHARKIFKWKG